jgi:hypothetical protein
VRDLGSPLENAQNENEICFKIQILGDGERQYFAVNGFPRLLRPGDMLHIKKCHNLYISVETTGVDVFRYWGTDEMRYENVTQRKSNKYKDVSNS